MSAGLIAAPAGPDDDGAEVLAGREPCACGALAAVVLIDDGDTVWAAVRCRCGSFRPAAADGSPSAPVGEQETPRASRDVIEGDLR